MPTVAEALRKAARVLRSVSDTARLDAELLMAEALGVPRSDMLLRRMTDEAPKSFEPFVDRRLDHEPIAYIVGTQEFFGRVFHVTPDVLIPRADSEATLGAALAARPDPRRVLDCGTGSGALLLSLLAERPLAAGVGVDRSAAALSVAKGNATRLGLADRAELRHADWTVAGWTGGLGRFDLVIANPPYVEEAAALDPSVRDHEPAGALFAGLEGLGDYRVLVPQLPALLGPEGAAVLEIGASQADAVAQIAAQVGFRCELRRDLAGRSRALVLRLGLV
jgi:release factor glutamine methyltransferase